MDLTWSDEQRLLSQTVADVCARYCTPEKVRALEDDATGYPEDLWKELASLGLLGLTIPEELGGAGASLLAAAIVCEELGRAIAPTPYIVSSILAAALIRRAGTQAQKETLLPAIASGEQIVSVACFELERGLHETSFATRVERDVISGAKILVPFARSASKLLVVGRDGGGVAVFVVDPAAPGVTMEQEKTMAADASYTVTFDAVPAQRLGSSSWATFLDALDEALVALAAYAVGGAARAHEMAVEYAKEREQFGRKIGAFQGIAHPLADTATDIDGARVLVWQAAWSHATGKRDAATLSAMAKLYACDAFKRTTKVGQQTFGGIGFIRDVDMQLYFRRAKQMEILWLGPRELEERIAAAELDAATPFVAVDAAD